MDAVPSPDSQEPPGNALARRARPLGRHLLRWSWFYLSILAGHMAKENYFPFSNWPMYANFATTATYIYAVDGHGNEIPWRTMFGQTAAPLKRQYESERDRIEQEQGVDRDTANVLGGEALIGRLARRLSVEQLEAMGGTLTVHYMGISFNDDREREHRSKAVSTIQLDEIIAEKRAADPDAAEDPAQDEPAAEPDQPVGDDGGVQNTEPDGEPQGAPQGPSAAGQDPDQALIIPTTEVPA